MDVQMYGMLIGRSRDFEQISYVRQMMDLQDIKPDRWIYCYLISFAPTVGKKRQLVSEMRMRGIDPDSKTWSHLAKHGIYYDDF